MKQQRGKCVCVLRTPRVFGDKKIKAEEYLKIVDLASSLEKKVRFGRLKKGRVTGLEGVRS